jgi:outer membrane biogenesis lipoprotein LolB
LAVGRLPLAIFLLSCAHAPPQGPAPDAVELFERARAAHQVPQTMMCDAKAFVDARQNGGRYALHIAVRRPASIHIEALTPLGDPAAVMVADQGRFALLDLRSNVFYRGPASPENLSRLLPAPLRDEELVALLTGAIPELPGGQPQSVRRQGDGFLLVLSSPGESQEIDLGADLRVNEVRRKGWTVHLDEHDDKSGAQVPRLLHLSAPSAHTEVDLRLRNMETGLPPPSGAFLLGVPPGMRVEEVP